MFVEVYYVIGTGVLKMNKAWSWPQRKKKKKNSFYWAWWHTLTITESQSLRQEYHKFSSQPTSQTKKNFHFGKVVSRSNDIILNNI